MTPTSQCRWGDSAAPSAPAFHRGSPPQTRHHGDLEERRADPNKASRSAEAGLPLTSTGVKQLRPLDEAQVARPGPQSLGVPEAQLGVEMVSLQTLLAVDGVVATGIVGTAYPDLKTKDVDGEIQVVRRVPPSVRNPPLRDANPLTDLWSLG